MQNSGFSHFRFPRKEHEDGMRHWKITAALRYNGEKDGVKMQNDTDWVEVLVTYDSLEAEIIKDLLESGGIPVVLRSSKVSPYPVNIGRMGEIKVLVKKEDKESAEKVISADEEESSDFPE